MKTSAIILAGGKSRRFGRDKRRLWFAGLQGKTLLEHMVFEVSLHCDDVVVVLNDPEDWSELAAQSLPDAYPETGPLGGIASGLAACKHDQALVLACDMPMLQYRLIQHMLQKPSGYDILAPRTLTSTRNHLGIEPLHAIYHRRCIAPIEQMLQAGEYQIAALYDRVVVEYLEPDELRRYDLGGYSFLNINTEEDYQEIKMRLQTLDH